MASVTLQDDDGNMVIKQVDVNTGTWAEYLESFFIALQGLVYSFTADTEDLVNAAMECNQECVHAKYRV